jgi:hypothetical protein
MVAIVTMICAPSATDWCPRLPFRSVPVKPGSTTLTLMFASALAYWTVSMMTAALDEA